MRRRPAGKWSELGFLASEIEHALAEGFKPDLNTLVEYLRAQNDPRRNQAANLLTQQRPGRPDGATKGYRERLVQYLRTRGRRGEAYAADLIVSKQRTRGRRRGEAHITRTEGERFAVELYRYYQSVAKDGEGPPEPRGRWAEELASDYQAFKDLTARLDKGRRQGLSTLEMAAQDRRITLDQLRRLVTRWSKIKSSRW